MKTNTLWTLWAKALGQKASKSNVEADQIAFIRSLIFTTYLLTNLFIVAGVIRHWNDNHEIPSSLPETKKEKLCETSGSLL